MSSSADPTGRFSGRVGDYTRGRPGYPSAIVDDLEELGFLFPGASVADVGSGTGISSELFLSRGYEVFGVEPNRAMRAAAEARFGGIPGFRSVEGRAEATGLASASIDLVVAAQAFHWFDAVATRREVARVLRPRGAVALVWNARRAEGTPFLRAYEDLLLRFGTDYAQVGHRGVGAERLDAFFRAPYEVRRFETAQELDLEHLRARLLSSSYLPAEGDPAHARMLAELERIFLSHATRDRVQLLYDTELFAGRLAS
jgi:SAM-dependent methyltransferase